MAEKKEFIRIRGARENNLKALNVDIPRNQFVVFTGLSGSGKSSLAFDTIYAEGQRRYMESLSSYARQFLGQMEKPNVDSIEGLPPAISIDQKSTNRNPRSTVGTVTEIYEQQKICQNHIADGNPIACQSQAPWVVFLQKMHASYFSEPPEYHQAFCEGRTVVIRDMEMCISRSASGNVPTVILSRDRARKQCRRSMKRLCWQKSMQRKRRQKGK